MTKSLQFRVLLVGSLLTNSLMASATNPVLTFRGTVATGDNTAFIDQVQILTGPSGNSAAANAVANAGFEISDPLAQGTYGYVATGATWAFGSGSGIAAEGNGFNPTNPTGDKAAFLQGASQFQQTLTLAPGTYRVRFNTAQRNFNGTNTQKIQVLIDGVVVADNLQPNSTTFSAANQFTTAAFTVAASTPFDLASLAPARNQRGVARGSSVALTFNQALNAASAAGVSIFSSQYGGRLALRGAPVVSGNTATLIPNRFFKAGEAVSMTLPNTVVSNALGQASNSAQVYQFTVATQSNGAGNGTFNGTQNAAVGTDPRGNIMADVDGDGRLDLIVVSASSVSVFRNTGNSGSPAAPTFAARTILDLPNGATGYSIVAGDVDGDGRIDLVTANQGTNNVSIFRNTSTVAGSVSFASSQQYPVDSTPFGIALGDLDGDGDLDIATTTFFDGFFSDDAGVSLLRNVIISPATLAANGLATTSGPLTAASFAPQVYFSIGNSIRYDLTLGDLDSDGQLDIVTANDGPNTVGIYRNLTASPAAFSFGNEVLISVGSSPTSVALGDVNGDGKLDIMTANFDSDDVTILQNTTPLNSTTVTASRTNVAVGNQPFGITVGDITADGKLNILVTNYNNGNAGTVSILQRNAANTAFVLSTSAVNVGNGPTGIAMGDLDGDGDLDLATANFNPNTVSLRINGTTAAALPLPVELVSFVARCSGAGTVLTWRTATEKNSASFDVQRSADGKTFESIATVKSLGNSASGGTYTTTDERAPASAYYRLRMVDADGTAAYSPVAQATCATLAETAAGLTLVPNPAQGQVQVLGAREAVQLLDLTGRVLRQQAPAAGSLNLEGLAPGIYLVRSGKHTARLQVQ